MRVILVRHGQTHHNVNGITQGHFDAKLTPEGMRQAQLVAMRLKEEAIDTAYSSDLSRAYETCRAIMSYHPGVMIQEDKRLRERSLGIYENRPRTDWQSKVSTENGFFAHWLPVRGESLHQAKNRMIDFWNDLVTSDAKTAVIVSHGAVISALLSHLKEENLYEFETFLKNIPGNTGVSVIQIDKEKKILAVPTLNCQKHLDV